MNMNIEIQEKVPLAPLTTFDIGGNARFFTEVSGAQGVQEAIEKAREWEVPYVVIAGGSNLLVSDEGFDGLIIRITGGSFKIARRHVFVDAGYNLEEIIRATAVEGLAGWEHLAGIPGSVGGAVRGNAGVFGTEIRDVLVAARALNTKTGLVRDFSPSACGFSYRTSFFKRNPEWIVTNVVLELRPGDAQDVLLEIEDTVRERNKKHIQNIKAAGSFFMNPVAPTSVCRLFENEKGVESRGRRVPAGWLIEKAGMKGERVGGAMASEMHPNYILNVEGATARDVLTLAEKVKKAVLDTSGVMLEEEVKVL